MNFFLNINRPLFIILIFRYTSIIFYARLTFGLFSEPCNGVYCFKKLEQNPFIKNLAVIFIDLKEMHALSTDYGSLCIITSASIS